MYQIGEKDYVLVTKEDTDEEDGEGGSIQFRFELMEGVETKISMSFKDEDKRDDSFDSLSEEKVLSVVDEIRSRFARESEK
jgi:hypothetical protein